MRDVMESVRILRAGLPLAAYPDRVTDDLARWAQSTPHAIYLAERDGAAWRTISFAAMHERVRRTAAGLLAAGGTSTAPIAIVADNGIEHAVVSLAAMYAGIPVSPLSTNYARQDADPARLRALLDVLRPCAAFVPDAASAERVTVADPALAILQDAHALESDPAAADSANAAIGPDTIAKILFTSGSTGTPKGVITTHRMLCANQTMVAQVWPAAVESPVLVDWAPWSHTAAGNKIFGIALRHGGSFYVDGGKPLPGAIDTTLRNLREIAPTFYFNVPRGWALLADAFESDETLARTFFSRVRVLLNAGASLPDALRRRIASLARTYGGRDIPVVSSWGATETAPMATASWSAHPAEPETIGTPVPGVEIKLAPVEDRFELRVRGVTVTPGYWRNAMATAAAFDEDGFYRSGDAARLFDDADPSRGIVFDGRLSENFKLSSGTWVNVGAVRLALLEAGAPLIEDVVLAGLDRDDLGALVFVAPRARAGGTVTQQLRRIIERYNQHHSTTSMRIARALVMPDAPNAAAGEITDKGSVNQRRVLANRAADVARLFAEPLDPDVLVFPSQP
ncbi:MAG: feruloyl-CoA synthase [Candidatus Eremiobacteraeota bacterium]|nr:feruloyl-CoA synthase [Candidatus Eremiobacteraeota bacterium]